MAALKNPKHEAFAQELAKGVDQHKAYINAGYEGNKTAASRLAKNVNVSKRIQELIERSAKRAEVDIGRILKEIETLSTSDLRRVFDSEGKALHPKDWPDDFAAAVSSIEYNDDGTYKLKLWDKNSAIDKFLKIKGAYAADRIEHSGKVQTEDVTPQAIANVIEGMSPELRAELARLAGRDEK
jgi:phage terminase small subunit